MNEPKATGKNAILGLINKYNPVIVKNGQMIARIKIPNKPNSLKVGTLSNSLKVILTSFFSERKEEIWVLKKIIKDKIKTNKTL